jgi:D-sedoheptulose 7-phosphate isomerase
MQEEFNELIKNRINEEIRVQSELINQADKLAKIAELIINAYSSGKKVILFGNGGSAADAQHIAAEFLGKFCLDRKPLPAEALNVNTSTLTAIGNDFGFDQVFARQIEALGNYGDIAIGISTSGNSPNILEAIKAAKRKGLLTIGLTGISGGKLKEAAQHCICVPSNDTPRIQEAHILIGHILCELVEKSLTERQMNRSKTVFLDRDGVINRKQPEGDYVKSWPEFEFLPRAKEALKLLKEQGRRIIITTNQRGIQRGLMTENDLQNIHARMEEKLAETGVSIDKIYYCQHEEGTCSCRKPQTGMFLQAQKDFPEIDFRSSAVIGDSLSDMEAGSRLNCRTILIADDDAVSQMMEKAQIKGITINAVANSLYEAVTHDL